MSSSRRPLGVAAVLLALAGVVVIVAGAMLGPSARGAGEPSASPSASGSNPGTGTGGAGVAAAWVPTLGNCVPPGGRVPGWSPAPVLAGGSPVPAGSPASAAGTASPVAAGSPLPAGASPSGAMPAITAGRVSKPPRWRTPSLVATVPILMYHRIVTRAQGGSSLPSLEVAPSVFADQMAALAKNGWRSITLRQLAADLAAGRKERARTVVITFDDGYRDGYLNAAPILKRYGMVGTFFVITGRIGDNEYLTPTELCQMTAQGDEIANHSVHHVDLAAQSVKRAAWEIDTAATQIRRWTGVAPVTLAYPFGTSSASVVDHVRSDGYWIAVSNVEGAGESWPSRFLVPRVRVGPGMSGASLLVRLSPYAGS